MGHPDPGQAQALGESQDDPRRRLRQHRAIGRRRCVEPGMGGRSRCHQDEQTGQDEQPHRTASLDAVGVLQFPDIGHDQRDVLAGQAFDPRHVPEPPVMGSHADCDRPLERLVAMVAGFVDDVNQRRGDIYLPYGVRAVAGGAFRVIELLSGLRFGREGRRKGDLDQRRALRAVCASVPALRPEPPNI